MTRQDLRNRHPTFTYSMGYTPPVHRPSGWSWACLALLRVLGILTALAIGYGALGALGLGWLRWVAA